MVQVPVARTVTVEPLTEHTDVVVDENVTGPPADDVADSAKGASFNVFDDRAPKVTLCGTTPLTSVGRNAFSEEPLPSRPFDPAPQQ
jgi:hypothetical protein